MVVLSLPDMELEDINVTTSWNFVLHCLASFLYFLDMIIVDLIGFDSLHVLFM